MSCRLARGYAVHRRSIEPPAAAARSGEEGWTHAACPRVLWKPEPTTARASSLAGFARFVHEQRGVSVDELDYRRCTRGRSATWMRSGRLRRSLACGSTLARWRHWPRRGCREPSGFPAPRSTTPSMRWPTARAAATTTLRWCSSARTGWRLITYELRDLVERARRPASARRRRRRPVVALMPNCVEAVAAFLAVRQPGGDVVVVLTGLRDACRARSVRPAGTVGLPRSRRLPLRREGVRRTGARAALRQQIPGLTATVLVPYLDAAAQLDGASSWAELTAEPGPARIRRGAVRPSALGLVFLRHNGTPQRDRARARRNRRRAFEDAPAPSRSRPGERFFWFTTTGWMMWNLLVSGLLTGSTVVLYDGNPATPTSAHCGGSRRNTASPTSGSPRRTSCLKAAFVRSISSTCRRFGRWARPARRCRPKVSVGSPTRSASTSRSARSPAGPTCARRSWRRRRPCRCGSGNCRVRRWAPPLPRTTPPAWRLSTRSASWC